MEVLLSFSPKHGVCQVWSPPDERDQIEKAWLWRTESVEKRWKEWLWKQVPKSNCFNLRPGPGLSICYMSCWFISFWCFIFGTKTQGKTGRMVDRRQKQKWKHGETSMQMAPWWQDSGFAHLPVSYMRARQGWAGWVLWGRLLWQVAILGLFRAPGSCPDDIMLLDDFWCFVYHSNCDSSWMRTARDARTL